MIMANPDMLPPGFRFHPTDEELILHYLRNRAANAPCPVAIIADVDIYKHDPWDLPSRAAHGDKEWYFFTPRDRKYPNGIRPNRAAGCGYWKATGTDKPIKSGATGESVGVKKALVFYKGRPPKGTKTNWIMHEYRLAADVHAAHTNKFRNASMRLDDWVLCRIYKKASHATPMSAAPLSDHEQADEPCGFDENPYAATSAAMLLQGASSSFPAMHTVAPGAQRTMPRIPSLTELFNDPSLVHYFFEEGGMVPQQDMPRLGNHHQQQQHAPLLGRPVTSQLLVNNGNGSNGNGLSAGQLIPQMDPPPASTTSAAGDGAAGKRKRSSDSEGCATGAVSSQQAASAAKKPNGSCFGAATFQIGNGLQAQGSLGHQMLLHSNMGMN